MAQEIDYYNRYGFYKDELSDCIDLPDKPIIKEKKVFPTIDSIREFQNISGHLSNVIAPDENPDNIFGHLEEEMVELRDALITGERKTIASEIPDLVILAFRMADMYGIDMSQAMTRKLHRNGEKYMGPSKHLIENGVDPKEARRIAKENWDKNRDKDFDID